MAKNNVRSFRYTDEVARMLDASDGNNMSEKFENLVHMCHYMVPEVLDRKRYLEDDIRELRKKRDALYKQVTDLEDVQRQRDRLLRQFEDYGKQMQTVAEAAAKVSGLPLL